MMAKGLGLFLRFLLFALRPFRRLRLGLIPHRSLGRLAANTEFYLRRRSLEPPPAGERHVLVAGPPVNRQLLEMQKRRARILESEWLAARLRAVHAEIPDHPLWLDLRSSGFYVWRPWIAAGPQLGFTDHEEARGRGLLAGLGLPAGARYVCLHARDKTYTDSPDFVRRPDDRWSYNDYRDCDIRRYLPAARYLAERGLWVVRVGHRVEGPLAADHPRIIDYAARHRGDLEDPEFADVYLQAHCKFFLGCTAGIYLFSSIFEVPVAYANMAPLGECGRAPRDLFIPKKYRRRGGSGFIPFAEMIERGADRDTLTHAQMDGFDRQGIEFVENTAEEIVALAQEMNDRLDGTWVPGEDDEDLQRRFRALFPAGHAMSDFPGRVGAEFLRRHHDLLS